MKPVNILNKLKESSEYRYITTHGTGPGTLPKDVNLIKSEDINSNGRVAIYVDRPLTKEELEKYDIKPEWIQESSDYSSDDWKAFEHHKDEFKDYYELPHGILFRDKNKPTYGIIMNGKFMLDAEPIPKDGEYRTDNSTLDKIKIKDEDFSPVEDFVVYYLPSNYNGQWNSNDLRKKYFGNNLGLYSQPDEVVREINSDNFTLAKDFEEVLDDYENNPESDWYIDIIKAAQEQIAERKERENAK